MIETLLLVREKKKKRIKMKKRQGGNELEYKVEINEETKEEK